MGKIYPPEGREAKQPLRKALARHPLVLLDQQLQRLAKDDDYATQKQVRR